MRKIISAIVSLSVLGLMIAPVVLAQITPPTEIKKCVMRHDLTSPDFVGFKCPAKGADCPYDSSTLTCGPCCILDTIYTVTDWFFYIVLAFAIIFIIFGAFNIMTAGGSPEKVKVGRDFILYAIIGLLVGLIAKSMPYIARAIIGG
jgi:hypothetical protein